MEEDIQLNIISRPKQQIGKQINIDKDKNNNKDNNNSSSSRNNNRHENSSNSNKSNNNSSNNSITSSAKPYKSKYSNTESFSSKPFLKPSKSYNVDIPSDDENYSSRSKHTSNDAFKEKRGIDNTGQTYDRYKNIPLKNVKNMNDEDDTVHYKSDIVAPINNNIKTTTFPRLSKKFPMRPVSAIDKGHRSGPPQSKKKVKFINNKKIVLLPKDIELEEGYPSELDELLDIEKPSEEEIKNDNTDEKKEEEIDLDKMDREEIVKLAAIKAKKEKKVKKEKLIKDSDDEDDDQHPKPVVFKNNIRELDKKQHSTPSSEVFALSAWSSLKLSEKIVKHLELFMNKKQPTVIQSMAIPKLLAGKDLLVQSPTGTGKTLTYLIPIVHHLASLPKKLTRSDGTNALIIAPTRELCIQIFSNAELLVKPFIWIIPGSIMGGENRASEKARLRKGINILIATPGRLLDHIQTTQSFVIKDLYWLILDEADRLLDLGFERDIRAIIQHIDKLSTKRQSLLISATLRGGIRELSTLMLKDPQFVCFTNTDSKALTDKIQEDTNNNFDSMLIMKEQLDKQQVYSLPKGLVQMYVETTIKQRLVALASLLRGKIEQSKEKNFKGVVFFSTCASVDFHHALLGRSYWPDDGALNSGRQFHAPAAKLGQKRKNAKSDDDDDEDENEFPKMPLNNDGLPLLETPMFKLHGDLTQLERTETYFRFCKADAGILFTTNVAARGLDLPAVDCIVQYDPPEETTEYVHRVGRTARLGRKGEAILFLTNAEMGYVSVLEKMQIALQAISPFVLFGYLKLKDRPKPQGILLETVLQSQFQRIVNSEARFGELAQHGFHSYCRAYAGYPRAMKTIFHVRNLHLGHVASSFALTTAPSKLEPAERPVKKQRRTQIGSFTKVGSKNSDY